MYIGMKVFVKGHGGEAHSPHQEGHERVPAVPGKLGASPGHGDQEGGDGAYEEARADVVDPPQLGPERAGLPGQVEEEAHTCQADADDGQVEPWGGAVQR